MTPISGIIIPILTYEGTPPSNFGKNGQYCYDGTNHLMYGPKTAGSWGTGRPFGNVVNGTAEGNSLYWNGSGWADTGRLLFESDGVYFQYYTLGDLVPTMVSNTSPSGIAFGSEVYSASYDYYKAFDNNNTTIWASKTTPTYPLYLGYDFNDSSQHEIVGYYLYIHTGSTRTFPDWTFEGWDGSQWVTLDTQAGYNWSANGNAGTFYCAGNHYKYRIYIASGTATEKNMTTFELLSVTATSQSMKIMNSGKIGINTAAPEKKLEITDSSAAQLRLSQAAGSKYTDFQTDSNGDLIITPNGGDIKIVGDLQIKETLTAILTTTGTPTERQISKIIPSMPVTTDASRTGRVKITASDYSTERDILQGDADGSKATAIIVGQTLFTEFGGIARKVINKTGAATVKGSVVMQSATTDNGVSLATDAYDALGVLYESGIADGSETWMVYRGVAEVLVIDSHAVTRGEFCQSSTTAGRVTTGSVPSPPNDSSHFKECGHAIESKSAGTDVLFKMDIHLL